MAISSFSIGLNKSFDLNNLKDDLTKALENEDFFLVFQPQYLIDQDSIRGFEALLRWNHPVHGTIPPSIFIPLAEQRGIIHDIGIWVFKEILKQMQHWHSILNKWTSVSVNVSPFQLIESNNRPFSSMVISLLKEYNINPNLIELELTESLAFYLAENKSLEQIELLRKQGIRFALDDFGEGFSSLDILLQLPSETVKIDQTLIKKLPDSINAQTIIRSLVDMFHELNMKVVAEGVETKSQYLFLKNIGCDFIQGYLLHPPLQKQEVLHILKTNF